MPAATTLGLCALASLALLVIPGPAVLFIVTRSVEHGRRVGLASVVGVHLGTLVHVAAAALGLSALLVSSATAFGVVKYVGAAYLAGLGLHRLLSRPADGTAAASRDPLAGARSVRSALAQGAVVNVLNPKVALFFLAFLPPFVDPRRGPVATQVVVLGLLYLLLGMCSDGAYALAAAALAGRVRGAGFARRGRKASGVVYLALGVLAALTPRHPSGPGARAG